MSRRFFQTDNEVALAILAQDGPSAFAVYSILVMHMDWETRISRPAQTTICALAKVSESTCKRSLHALERDGYIVRSSGQGRGHHAEYLLKGFPVNPFNGEESPTEKGSEKGSRPLKKGPQGTHLDDKRVHDATEKGSRQALKGFTTDPPLTCYERDSERDSERDVVGGGAPQKAVVRRATRLPDDWDLPDEWRDHPDTIKAQTKRPWVDLDVEELRFRNYWTSKARDAAKLDWFRTWINWLYNVKPEGVQPRPTRAMAPTMNGRRGQSLEEKAIEIQRKLDEREAQRCK